MKLSREEIETSIKILLDKYNGKYAILFGSYARGDATEDSDIDVIVVGNERFRGKDIFSFGEELRQLTNKSVDEFEIREVNKNTEFYDSILREGVHIG